MRALLYILTLFLFVTCKSDLNDTIVLNFEKDLIPEGIAIDTKTKTIFLNSLKKSKIVKCRIDGSNPTEFITSNQYGYLSGFGMTIKGDTLFALGNNLSQTNNKSILLLIDIKTQNLINSFLINDLTFRYLNDLAISSTNDIYITDSESNRIYTVQQTNGKLEVFLESNEITNPNGICISDDGRYLYVATYKMGIRIIDLKSKEIINQPNNYTGIDGLKFYQNSVIGIVNAKRDISKQGIYRYYLSKDYSKIISKDKINSHGKYFDVPTTFDILENHLVYIANSQIDNFDQESNNIIDKNELEQYLLVKWKID